MPKTSFKNKIYIVFGLLVALSASMFLYFFHLIDNSNRELVTSFSEKYTALEKLQAEQESFRQANSDLQKVKNEKYQPGDLFSKDISFVNELRILESLGKTMNVDFSISGISGTVKTAQKAPTLSPLVQIPYGITLNGSLNNCLMYMEALENLKFVTTLSSVGVSSDADNKVIINISGFFYLSPQ